MCEVSSLRKIHVMEAQIQPRMFFVPQVKCLLLLTNRNKTYIISFAWAENFGIVNIRKISPTEAEI
jgi:hypothetical protein